MTSLSRLRTLIGKLRRFIAGSPQPPSPHGPSQAPPPPEVEPATCHLHGDELQIEIVRIAYGYPAFLSDKEYGRAWQEQFPNANSTLVGGCVVYGTSPREAPTLYCESCRRAKAAWSTQTGRHRDPPAHSGRLRRGYDPATDPRSAPGRSAD